MRYDPKTRKYSRRNLLKICGSALVSMAAIGCGRKKDSQTLTILSPMGEVKNRALKAQINSFMSQFSDIPVELITVPWDQAHTKLLIMIAGGNPPDLIISTGQWIAEFRAMGALENLAPWYNTWCHRNAFNTTAIRRCKSSTAIKNGKIYGLPLELTTRAMFYQRRWLDDIGMEPALTRADWRRLLEKMTNQTKTRYGYALRGGRGGFWSWCPILEEFSGTNEWFDKDNRCIINSPEHVKGLSYWNDLYQDGLTPKDSINWGYNELVQSFWSGVCGCIEQDPEVVRTCLEHGMDDSTLVTTRMPSGPRASVASNDIWILSISSNSQKFDQALTLYEWIMSPEHLISYSKAASVLPTVKAGMADPHFGQGFLRPFMDMLDDTKYLSNWYPSYLPEMGEFIEVLVTEEQQKMLLGRQSPQEMLDRLAEFLNRAQNRYVDNYGPNTPRPLSIL